MVGLVDMKRVAFEVLGVVEWLSHSEKLRFECRSLVTELLLAQKVRSIDDG